MINYSIVMRHNPLDKTQPKKAYAVAQSRETMDLSSFAKHISDHGCVYSRADISCILTMAVDCLRESLLNGARVQLGELGTFGITLRSVGEESIEDFTAVDITDINVIWTPGAEFKNLINSAEFNVVPSIKTTQKLLKAIKAGETSVDLTDSTEEEDASQEEENNASQGSDPTTGGTEL